MDNLSREIGQCVYCASFSDLTDEHVVPEGLGGKVVLKKASCSACADMTSRFERVFLREMMHSYRYYHSIRGKKKKRSPDDAVWVDLCGAKLLAMRDDLPTIVIFPLFNGPRRLGRDEPGLDALVLCLPAKNRHAKVAGAEIESRLDPRAFARALAKIAHCSVCFHYGLEDFQPMLLPLIRGEIVDFNEFLGTDEAATSSDYHFHVELEEVDREDGTIIVAHIYLLSCFGRAAHFWLPAAAKR